MPTVAQLKSQLKAQGLSTNGNKSALVARLAEFESAAVDPSKRKDRPASDVASSVDREGAKKRKHAPAASLKIPRLYGGAAAGVPAAVGNATAGAAADSKLTAANAAVGLRVHASGGGKFTDGELRFTGGGKLLGWKVSGVRHGDTSGGVLLPAPRAVPRIAWLGCDTGASSGLPQTGLMVLLWLNR